ncbi:DUF397 domain-containing protein [Micromonospora sagamiensis]|uniref:Uncharacterized protein DUF397 n=1 Tax=Micromonospora sagamiensis TaxID=47875 RepID=A0A562WCF2_9ACTN|nr:DUF397 domain-containing protein [Micromonospora sagamiensis]TWJ27304.1 uncharacterized protein DUF397 [Micromonospora sagamiensis]BCL13805.1 hypothetical protein GCM10017556_15440 [Micromonospora sagamiensis]
MNQTPDTSSVGSVALTDAAWRTSSRSQTSNCVEVAPLPAGPTAVALRDSKDRGGPVLLFRREQWRDFLTGTRNGEFAGH